MQAPSSSVSHRARWRGAVDAILGAMRHLLVLPALLLVACAPVRGDDDDSSSGTSGLTLEDRWEDMNPGDCLVLPEDNGFLPEGSARATSGLWYDVQCLWIGGNASQIVIEPFSFDEVNGGDFEVSVVRGTTPGGEVIALGGDPGTLHLMPSAFGVLNGWWEGDLEDVDSGGNPVRLEAVIFKDAAVDQVVGR